jgi:poly-gamma-glutamate capsule biosynthesis protein CapA/YwtB (metallophosphatase superfamily)
MTFVTPRSLRALRGALDEARREFESSTSLPLDAQRAIAVRALGEVPLAAAVAARAGHASRARALIAQQPWDAEWTLAGVPWEDVLSSALIETI